MRPRTQAGFDTLIKNPIVDPAKIALIGYCFGGMTGVEFASTGAPLIANVSIHGSFRDHPAGWAKNARGMFLILHGAEDEGYPLTAVDKVIQELRANKVPFSAGTLQWYGARLLQPEEQGRRTRQRAVDRLNCANAERAFRHGIGSCPDRFQIIALLSSSLTSALMVRRRPGSVLRYIDHGHDLNIVVITILNLGDVIDRLLATAVTIPDFFGDLGLA